MNKVTLVLSQFGSRARELEPGLSSFRAAFPDSRIILYSDNPSPVGDIDIIHKPRPPFDRNHPRYGHRAADYYKLLGLLHCTTGVAIAFDTDTRVVNVEACRNLVPLAQRLGLCLPANSRLLVRHDAEIGAEGRRGMTEPWGWLHAVNMTPIAFDTQHALARKVLEVFLEQQLQDRVRGPLAMWRACWTVGFAPAILPQQWCVCWPDIGCGNEIILHVGHEKVRTSYGL